MSDTTKHIVALILQEKYNKAKTLITESMNEKIGLLLEETLVSYAPTIFEEKKRVCDCGEKNCKCGKIKKKDY